MDFPFKGYCIGNFEGYPICEEESVTIGVWGNLQIFSENLESFSEVHGSIVVGLFPRITIAGIIYLDIQQEGPRVC